MAARILSMLCIIASFVIPSVALASGDTIKIGVLNDETGVFADSSGHGSVTAAQMAVDDFGGKAAGKKIEVIFADHQNKADIGAGIARKWFDTEGVDAIADLGNSSVALAVSQIARDRNKAILVSAGGDIALTGAQCSPNTVQWTYDTHSQSAPLAIALVKRGHNKWFFLTASYTFGASLQKEATNAVLANGGEVVGSVRHPLNTMDFSSFLLEAQASSANVLALANGGADTTVSIKQANEFGLTNTMVIVGLAALITDVNAVGLQATHGLLLSLPFYWDINEGTRAFSKRWAAQNNGRMPTMIQAGNYGAVLHYLKAVDALGGADDGKKVVDKMKELPTDDPLFGKGYVRADGRTIHNVYVFEVKSPEESKYPWDYLKLYETVPGEKAFLTMQEGGCPLVSNK
ncbi:ABC transporter substrate-binding protein [Methylocapsa sp. S129]|uniref:ABC transporter substrate-binding protein n=1 Tax=Methylocapsa sp. S129 TaxID=1641869 RepID=UPI00131AE3E7|nr:ABC transporter substrate-binding protein [Methylocapsa sp. S129]